MKALNHRKRHVPPGPCGLWFQAQQQLSKQSNLGGNSHDRRSWSSASGASSNNHGSQHEGSTFSETNRHSSDDQQPQRTIGMEDMSFSPAWTAAQQELELIAPYLPPTMSHPTDRYRQLRHYTANEYALLFEVERGDHDSFEVGRPPLVSKKILVMVDNVESHIHHNIWTVELKDETSCRIKAWMEPTLVQQQLQQMNTIIRPGVVWQLDRVGIIFSRVEERIERMLLIRGSAIKQVWTPEQAQHDNGRPQEKSPERHGSFLEWLEKRKALPLIDQHEEENMDEPDCPEDDPEDYVADATSTRNRVSQGDSLGLPAPRRLMGEEDEDEDRFEPKSQTALLGQHQIIASSSSPWSQAQIPPPTEQRDSPTAAASEQPTVVPTLATENDMDTQEVSLFSLSARSQQGAPPSRSGLSAQPPLPSELTPSGSNRPAVSPVYERVASKKQANITSSTSKCRRSPKSSQRSPVMTVATLKEAASDVNIWKSMLEDDDDNDESSAQDESDGQSSADLISQPHTNNTETVKIQHTIPSIQEGIVVEEGSKFADDSDGDDFASSSILAEAPSMFQNASFSNIDLGAFDEDDDDEDDD